MKGVKRFFMDKSKLNYQKNLLLIIVVLFWFAQYVYVPFQTPYLSTMQVSSSMIGIIIGMVFTNGIENAHWHYGR